MMIIYRAKNKINGKSYIGRTTESLNRRIYRHLLEAQKYSNSPFKRAIQKYGTQSFEWSIIDTADSTEILAEKEVYWISYFSTKVPNGYNLTEGGDGSYGCHPSEKTRKKMSKSGKGKHGKILSEETKRRISISLTGKPATRGRTGMPHTEETKRKMNISMLGRDNPAKRPEVREKLCTAWQRRKSATAQAEKEIRELLSHFPEATNNMVSITPEREKEEIPCQMN